MKMARYVKLFEKIPDNKVDVTVRLGANSAPRGHLGYVGTWVNDKTWGNGWAEHTYIMIGFQLVEYVSDDDSEFVHKDEK